MKKHLITVLTLTLCLFIILGAFVACDISSENNAPEQTTEYQWKYDDDAYKGPYIPSNPSFEYPETAVPLPEFEYITYYVASKESNKYHMPYCYYVDNILDENIIYFYSKSEARSEGYSACSACDP